MNENLTRLNFYFLQSFNFELLAFIFDDMEKNLTDLRENYKRGELNEKDCPTDPFELFGKWMNEAIDVIQEDANAMTVSTVDSQGRPSSRNVLLKAVHENKLIFYTHYESKKGRQLQANPHICLLFWWKELERQVRIEGLARKASKEMSEAYFHSRPIGSQIGSAASPQSQEVTKKQLIQNFKNLEAQYGQQSQMPKPEDWGGFAITPSLIEFWQGRPNRLHDRIEYQIDENGTWSRRRIAP
ncbi:MAG: pyridoxamine 5'-phosphate oxidase [Chitinophagales bacterium]|nr:pyridoxamine 5'-phosphate oxidase [Chitinophagales bacterium]